LTRNQLRTQEAVKKMPPRNYTMVRGWFDQSRPVLILHSDDLDLVGRAFDEHAELCKPIEAEWELAIYQHDGEPNVLVDESKNQIHNVTYVGSEVIMRTDFADVV